MCVSIMSVRVFCEVVLLGGNAPVFIYIHVCWCGCFPITLVTIHVRVLLCVGDRHRRRHSHSVSPSGVRRECSTTGNVFARLYWQMASTDCGDQPAVASATEGCGDASSNGYALPINQSRLKLSIPSSIAVGPANSAKPFSVVAAGSMTLTTAISDTDAYNMANIIGSSKYTPSSGFTAQAVSSLSGGAQLALTD